MTSKTICLKLTDDLLSACATEADNLDLSLGMWLRMLAEKEVGIQANPRQGFASLTMEERHKIGLRGAKKRWGRKK